MSYRKALTVGFPALVLASIGLTVLTVNVLAQSDLPSMLRVASDLEQRQDFIAAGAAYNRAAASYPSQSTPLERLGNMLKAQGSYSDAAKAYRRALQINPQDDEIEVLAQWCERAAREQAVGVVKAATYRAMPVSRDAGDSAMTSAMPATTRGTAPYTVPSASAPSSPAMSNAAQARTIPVRINFPRNKFSIGDLDDTARRQLDEVVDLLAAPEWANHAPLVVEGHACSCGTDASNLALGQKRGEAILGYLVAKHALRPDEGSVLSMGRAHPIVESKQLNLSADACARNPEHSQNRRVIIREVRAVPAPSVSFWVKPAGQTAPKPMADGEALYARDELRIKVHSANPMYAYVVHHGPENQWQLLYPAAARNGAKPSALLPTSSLDPADGGYWIPGPDAGYIERGKAGDEEAMVYLSPTPITELEARTNLPVQPTKPVASPKEHEPQGSSVAVQVQQSQVPTVAISEQVRSLVPAQGSTGTVRDSRSSVRIGLAGPPKGQKPFAVVKFTSH